MIDKHTRTMAVVHYLNLYTAYLGCCIHGSSKSLRLTRIICDLHSVAFILGTAVTYMLTNVYLLINYYKQLDQLSQHFKICREIYNNYDSRDTDWNDFIMSLFSNISLIYSSCSLSKSLPKIPYTSNPPTSTW